MSEDDDVEPLLRQNDIKADQQAVSYSTVNTTVTSVGGRGPSASKVLYLALFACVLGTSFQFGYSLGALNTPAKVIQQAYRTGFDGSPNATAVISSDSEITLLWSLTVSIYCVGGLIGGTVGGPIVNHVGRKRSMMLFNILQIISVFLMFSSIWWRKVELIIAGRFISGLHGGISTVVGPLYLSEISPMSLRGVSGTLHQLTVVIALTLAQVLGLPSILGTSKLFYYILGAPLIPAVLHWILLSFCPESPSWLYLAKKDATGSKAALRLLRTASVESEIEHYHDAAAEQASERKVTLKDMFLTYRKRPLLIAAVMHLSQQLSGINAVIFYSTAIFESAGLSESAAQYATLGLGVVNLAMTFVSMLLIERLGRRTLHLHGLGGMFITLALLSASFLMKNLHRLEWLSYGCIVFIVLFIVSFSIGPGSIPWFITSELFDHGSAMWAVSAATAVNWLANFCVGLLFPTMQAAMKDYAFFPFMAFLAIFWFYLFKYLPETKGKSQLEITMGFRSVKSRANLNYEDS